MNKKIILENINMKPRKVDFSYRIILLGNYDAGKTNFILRYVNNTYDSMTLRTIGIDFSIKQVTLNDGKTARIRICDTESSERFKSIISSQFRTMNGFIIMYNITRRESFENAINWLEDIRIYSNANTNNIAFVGNRVDIDENNDSYYKREILTEEGQKFAEDNNLLFFETSNLTGFNVNECFNALINRIYENDPNKNKLINNVELKLKKDRPGKRGCLK